MTATATATAPATATATAQQHALLQLYIRDMANKLCLRDWKIELVDGEPADATSAACCRTLKGRKVAHIKVSSKWTELAPAQQRHYITHELIHVHAEAMDDVLFYSIKGQLAPGAWEACYSEFGRALEYAVDGLADALAPYLPLPGGVPTDAYDDNRPQTD